MASNCRQIAVKLRQIASNGVDFPVDFLKNRENITKIGEKTVKLRQMVWVSLWIPSYIYIYIYIYIYKTKNA